MPAEQPDIGALERKAVEIENAIAARDRSAAKVEALNDLIARCDAEVEALNLSKAALNCISASDYVALFANYGTLSQAVEAAKLAVAEVDERITIQSRSFNEAKDAWDRADALLSGITAQIDQAVKDIEAINFNNALVKKVRAARPIVGNKLWAMVLASVSSIFSAIRGDKSVVSRDEGGFTVNGQPVECLSGSTLDVLGLAIRVALVKTFIPSAGLLVLDEAAAAMDSDRTLSFLAYVASCGFKQTILVTHESVSEDFANSVITLTGE